MRPEIITLGDTKGKKCPNKAERLIMDSGYLFQLPWILFGAQHHPKRHLWTKAAEYQVCLSCFDQNRWRREAMWTKDKKEGWRQHKASNKTVISHFFFSIFYLFSVGSCHKVTVCFMSWEMLYAWVKLWGGRYILTLGPMFYFYICK